MLLEGPLNFLAAVKFSLECCACCSYVPKWALSAFTATGKNTEQSKTYPKKEPLTSHMNLSRNYLIEWMRAKRRRSKDQLIVNICFDYRFAARVSRFSGFPYVWFVFLEEFSAQLHIHKWGIPIYCIGRIFGSTFRVWMRGIHKKKKLLY